MRFGLPRDENHPMIQDALLLVRQGAAPAGCNRDAPSPGPDKEPAYLVLASRSSFSSPRLTNCRSAVQPGFTRAVVERMTCCRVGDARLGRGGGSLLAGPFPRKGGDEMWGVLGGMAFAGVLALMFGRSGRRGKRGG
jgi:hypothetical protein